MSRYPSRTPPQKEGPRVNEDITAEKIRLISEDGNALGVVTLTDGLRQASEAGLDLVEIAPQASPPVCKILNYGKYKYEAQKKLNQAKKKQKVIEIKEVKLRPNIDAHDFDVKVRNMQRFLEDGNKVKVTLRFRGREMAHNELGLQVLERVKTALEEHSKVEYEPKLEGRQMIMILGPAK